jgi:hypothetical protein
LFSGLFGFLSSVFIEWFKKRKNPKEVETDISYKINTAAKDNVATAQSVIDILDDRLAKERVYYEDQIGRSKHSCEDKILELKNYYESQIVELKKHYDRALFDVQIKGEQERLLRENKNPKEAREELIKNINGIGSSIINHYQNELFFINNSCSNFSLTYFPNNSLSGCCDNSFSFIVIVNIFILMIKR